MSTCQAPSTNPKHATLCTADSRGCAALENPKMQEVLQRRIPE